MRLDILLEDYSNCRDDDRSSWMVVATLTAVAITLVGLLFVAVTQTCRFNASKSCIQVPDYLVAGAPLPPVAIIAYTQMTGFLATVRGFYMRAIEREIRRYAGGPLQVLPLITPASYVDLTMELISLRRGRPGYRMLAVALIVATLLVFGGFTIYIAIHVSEITQAIMLAIYGPLILVMSYETYSAGPGGRSLFSDVIKAYLAHRNIPGYELSSELNSIPALSRSERLLPAYLLLPRPSDWVKWIIAPSAFLASAWAIGDFNDWPRFTLVWFILEYFIYEARYQWNDVRGIQDDQNHPGWTKPLRLPGGPNLKHNLVVSSLIGVLRIIIAVILASITHTLGIVILLVMLVFGIAIIYEGLRTGPRIPLSSNLGKTRVIGIWLIIGFGYGIRGGVGSWLAGYPLPSLTLVTLAAFFASLGVMFVLLFWTLEAASYCESDGTSTLSPSPDLARKPHIAELLRYSGWIIREGANSIPGESLPILKIKQSAVYAPWNVALFLASTAGAAAGLGLLGMRSNLSALLIEITLSAAGALALIFLTSLRFRLGATALVTIALVGISVWINFRPTAIIAGLPWAAAAGLYSFYRESSYSDTINFGARLRATFKHMTYRTVLTIVRLYVGRQTWHSAGFDSQAPRKDSSTTP